MANSNKNNSLYNKEFLKGNFHPRTSAFYFKEWDGYTMCFHSHNSVEIMYVINGTCLVETKEASITMRKGEFVLLDANVEHRLQVEKDKPCRMLNLEFGFCEDDKGILSMKDIICKCDPLRQLIQSNMPYLVLRDSEEIYITLKSLIMELDRNDSNENLLIGLLYGQLLIRVSGLFCEEGINSRPEIIHVKKAVRFIHQHYDRDIQIKDIAAAANIHSGYLHRIFKSSKGCTINDYLMRIRIKKAKLLLANTDIQITDIPSYVGINSRQYFAYVFKRYTGCSPSSYRKTSARFESKH